MGNFINLLILHQTNVSSRGCEWDLGRFFGQLKIAPRSAAVYRQLHHCITAADSRACIAIFQQTFPLGFCFCYCPFFIDHRPTGGTHLCQNRIKGKFLSHVFRFSMVIFKSLLICTTPMFRHAGASGTLTNRPWGARR